MYLVMLVPQGPQPAEPALVFRDFSLDQRRIELALCLSRNLKKNLRVSPRQCDHHPIKAVVIYAFNPS